MFIPLADGNRLRTIPLQAVTITIITLCVLAQLALLALDAQGRAEIHAAFGLIPAVLLDQARLPAALQRVPAELSVLTALFVHSGWLHLVGNMSFLWVFGDNVEDAMGHWRFAAFYLVCGVMASLGHVASVPGSVAPLVGASGAVAGVLGAYLVLYPRVQVLVLVLKRWPLLLPARWLLGGWLVYQLYEALTGALHPSGQQVAWWAHLAGFATGVALALPLRRRIAATM